MFPNRHFIAGAVLFGVLFLISFYRLDPDFGWHVRTGEYIVQNEIPRQDIYSYTAPDFDWVNHEWLNDVLMAQLFQAGGYALVAFVFAGLWWFMMLLVTRGEFAAWPGVLFASALLPYAGIRPIVWSVLFAATLLKLLEARRFWVIPLLFLAWANLHGSFAFGLLVLGYYFYKSRKKELVKIGILSAAATFANPYGWRVYQEVFRTAFDGQLKRSITEWLPLHYALVTWVYIGAAITVFVFANKHKFKGLLNLRGLTFLMAVSSTRHVTIFTVFNHAGFSREWRVLIKKIRSVKLDRPRKTVLTTIAAFSLGAWAWGLSLQIPWELSLGGITAPESAVFIGDGGCSGQIFNDYDLGGYLIYKLDDKPVFIDGRMPSWRDKDGQSYLKEFFDVIRKPEVRREVFAKYGITCVVWSVRGSAPASLLKTIWQFPVTILRGDDRIAAEFIAGLKTDGWREVIKTDGEILLTSPINQGRN